MLCSYRGPDLTRTGQQPHPIHTTVLIRKAKPDYLKVLL